MNWWAFAIGIALLIASAFADYSQTPIFYDTCTAGNNCTVATPTTIITEGGGGSLYVSPTALPIIATPIALTIEYFISTASGAILLLILAVFFIIFLLIDRKKKKEQIEALDNDDRPFEYTKEGKL